MIAKLFLALCQLPMFRRIAWKPIYNYLAKKYRNQNDWSFMNYGYDPTDQSKRPVLDTKDEFDRYCIQLYHMVATAVDVKGKNVLEVGSGRGGGASYIKRYLQPSTMTGMDLADNAVSMCNEKYKHIEGLRYVVGNAEKIPFGDATFDVVINVESSHAYGSVDNFVAEVKRVLKPGGYFSITDLRIAEKMDILRQQLVNSGMKIISETNISPNVVEAILKDEERKINAINQTVKGALRKPFIEFAGAKGSKIHTDLDSGVRIYKHFLLQKA